MTVIRAHTRAAAPLTTTWSVLADQIGMSTWAPGSTRLEQAGDPPPDGVGAIRVVTLWPLKAREQIMTVEAPAHLTRKSLGWWAGGSTRRSAAEPGWGRGQAA